MSPGKKNCERFEPRSHFKSRLSLIVRVNVVLNRTVVVDSDCAVVIFRVSFSVLPFLKRQQTA